MTGAPAVPRDDRVWMIGLPVILAFLLIAFSLKFHAPWVEEDTWYGAVYSQAAHNNLRAGLLVTAGVPATLYFGPLPIPKEAFYVHHPTLFPLLITGAFVVFGEHEWAARLVPVACSLASVVLLWLLVRHAIGARAATFAAAAWAVMPMELHYGDLVDFEPCLVMLMLAALCWVQRWEQTARPRWAWLAAACCQLALWMDWPGYLFVLSLMAWFGWKRDTRWFAWLLFGLVGLSGVFFLLQTRWINADAWSDLWTALTMRVGSGTHTGSGLDAAGGRHFTAIEWIETIGRYLVENFQPIPLALALAGATIVIARRHTAPGLRWLGWATLPMVIAAVLYVVIFRNESFIHDFAPFYLIAAVAMMAGVALDAAWAGAMRGPVPLRIGSSAVIAALLVALAINGHQKSEEMRSQFLVLDGNVREPASLVPALGQRLRAVFSPDTTILANFDPYGSSLTYYTQRTILNGVESAGDWRALSADEPVVGGVIWPGAPHAAELLASLPAGELSQIEVDGIRFALWQPAKKARLYSP